MAYCILKSYKLKVDTLKIFQAFSRQNGCFFLDSSLNSRFLGRYSFLGIEPFMQVTFKNEDPFTKIRSIFNKYNMTSPLGRLPFLSGAVGYFAYDLGFNLEKKIAKRPGSSLGLPDCVLNFYNTAVIIDHFKKLLYISACGLPEKNSSLAKALAKANFMRVYNLISQIEEDKHVPLAHKFIAGPEDKPLGSNFNKEQYLLAVRKAKDYIRKGDIYQVNLSQRFCSQAKLPPGEIFRRLRMISPACFSAYFDAGSFQILSSSPERLLHFKDGKVTTRPMKGTRPRGENEKIDRILRKELINSKKDKAELVMIVDLERNDLGKVCAYDSIRVTSLREVEKYNTVYQTTANIEGRLYKDKDRFDLLRACFPGGSITGCPKIRAMEVINELEPDQRSIYTGSLGYLSFSGEMDFNILIRTILKKENMAYFGAGGGIVADSDPEEEYQETLVKARAMIEAIS